MWDKLLKKIEGISEEGAAYTFAGITFVTYLIIFNIFGLNLDSLKPILWIFIGFMVYGLFIYLTPRLTIVWNSIAGKVIFSALVFLGSAVSMSFSQQIVNLSLQVPSSPFIYTQSIVALLISPFVIVAFIGLAGLFIFPLLMPFFFIEKGKFSLKKTLIFWSWKRNDLPYAHDIGIIRIVAWLCFILASSTTLESSLKYTETIGEFAKWYAYTFETEKHSHCKIDTDSHIAYVNKDIAIAARKTNTDYEFSLRKCEIAVE
jgi:hypothetical protein